MPQAPRPPDEAARLAALHAYEVLDTAPEPSLDRLSRLAASILGTPMAMVTFVDDQRQWFKSTVGVSWHQGPRDESFCAHAVASRRLLEVPDAARDTRFAASPLVQGPPGIRFYAGAPLVTPAGFVLGTLCVADTAPRAEGLTPTQRELLVDLAALVVDELELRRTLRTLTAEQQHLEEVRAQLHDREAHYRRLFAQNPQPMWVVDTARGTFLDVNDAALALYGYARGDFLALRVDDLCVDVTEAALPAPDGAAPEAAHVEHWRHRRQDGSELHVRVQSTRAVHDGGNTELSLVIDLTAERQLEAQLRHAQKMEAVGALAGAIAHDFNNLLTVITGYADLIAARAETPEVDREDVAQIQRAGERAETLTRQLLAFGRRQLLHPRRCALAPLLHRQQPTLAQMLGEAIELSVSVADDVPDVVVDASQLEQVLVNLTLNASDAMPSGGELTIACETRTIDDAWARAHRVRPGRYAVIAVADNGVGMDEATRHRVFEPFFTTKTQTAGAGLGLPTAYGIVTQMGGALTVESEPSQGSTFWIHLPAAPAADDAATPEATPEMAPAPEDGHARVLIVEDDEGVRHFTALLLRQHGYDVIEADDGPTAFRLLAAGGGPVDLVLTDMVLPRMPGRDVAEALYERFGVRRAIFMSGYAEPAGTTEDRHEPGAHVIAKPFGGTALLATVRAALGAAGRPLRVVVADDEVQLRSLVARTLVGAGYEVVEVSDGRAAVDCCRGRHVDLLITDLVMPEQEGLETIRQVRSLRPGVPVLAMSGAFEGQFLDVARAFGADAVLQKPFDAPTVLDAVASLIGRP